MAIDLEALASRMYADTHRGDRFRWETEHEATKAIYRSNARVAALLVIEQLLAHEVYGHGTHDLLMAAKRELEQL